MTRFLSISRCLLLLALLSGSIPRLAIAQDASPEATPTGLPDGVIAATVVSIVDGDKLKVEIEGKEKEVNLIGADAPESGECLFDTSSRFLARLLPVGSTVWLEKDKKDTDGKKRLLRYVWIGNPNDGSADLVNVRVVRYGYAGAVSKDGNTRYDEQIAAAQAKAQETVDGVWDECGALHAEKPLYKCVAVPRTTSDAIAAQFTESFTPRLWKAVLTRANPEFPWFVAALGGVTNLSDLSDPDVAVWAVDDLENPTKFVTVDIMAGAFTEIKDGASLDPPLTESAPGYNETLACAGYVQPDDGD